MPGGDRRTDAASQPPGPGRCPASCVVSHVLSCVTESLADLLAHIGRSGPERSLQLPVALDLDGDVGQDVARVRVPAPGQVTDTVARSPTLLASGE